MGRKSAPQPLTLPNANSSIISHRRGNEQAALTITSNQPPVRAQAQAQAHQSSHHSPSIQPSTEPRSPTSPRQRTPLSASRYTSSTFQRSQNAQSPVQQYTRSPVAPPHDHRGPSQQASPSASTPSSLEQRSTNFAPAEGGRGNAALLQSRFSPSYNQTEPRKLSKGSGGFLHFSKSSKQTNSQSPNAQHFKNASALSPLTPGGETSPIPAQGHRENSSHNSPTHAANSAPYPSRSDAPLPSPGNHESSSALSPASRGKTKTFGILGKNKMSRDRDNGSPRDESIPQSVPMQTSRSQDESTASRTASAAQDRSFRDMMDSSNRNRSADRALPSRDAPPSRDNKERERFHHPSSHRDAAGSTFLTGLRNTSTRAAGMIGNRIFGKNARSGSTHEKEPHLEDEQYTIKVINLPLIEQTRLTRISKRLEDSRDKTEFWMPAFPWRAIDYLNYKGCDVEGLYRVPGSGPQIKRWQRRFDEQYDVNLFDEEELYDINIVGSMLKAWLRELPTELLPKAAQERISRECAGAEEVPQLLVDELSNLSPFNYYLLFAITCHLSLLLAHSDKNKMDFRNLCICFQPCMKIDAFCFKFLVCDWRDCWKGCKNEVFYIEQEYMLFDQPPPRGLAEPQQPVAAGESPTQAQSNVPPLQQQPQPQSQSQPQSQAKTQPQPHQKQQQPTPQQSRSHSLSQSQSSLKTKTSDTRHGSLDNGNKEASTPRSQDVKSKPKVKPLQLSESNTSVGSNTSSISTTMTPNGEQEQRIGSRDIRPLSPIQPLSPLGF